VSAASAAPDWAKDVVWYQIFPERFNNGDSTNDPTRESLDYSESVPENWKVRAWESEWFERDQWEKDLNYHFQDTLQHRRYGGDLQGVIDKLEYLRELGITGIYFNPIFYANSLHKYDGNSFHHIDPHFGPDPKGDLRLIERETEDPRSWQWTAADKLFLQLLQEAKAQGIRVIVDGVWNHTGRDFFAFKDILKSGQRSPYINWYDIIRHDDRFTHENEFDYRGWHGFKSLPEFANNRKGDNLASGPKQYIFNATKRWMDPNGDGNPSDGIDGWRLDVAEEVPHGFWLEWHRLVRRINPEAFTSAEIWGSAGQYLQDTHFISAMNYRGFAIPVKGWLIDGRSSADEFANRLNQERQSHPSDTAYVLQNLVDSHDTQRIASAIANRNTYEHYKNWDWFDYDEGERVNARAFGYNNAAPDDEGRRIWKILALFQATYVGAPMIYYGTEVGMWGADDPEDRMPTWWHRFDQDIFEAYQKAFQLRHQHPALRRGSFKVLAVHNDRNIFVFERRLEGERLIIILNRGDTQIQFNSATLKQYKLLYSTDTEASTSGLPPVSAAVFGK
jgi:glycosidase